MLVQRRHDGRYRLVRQHDHALLAGRLACAWRGVQREPAFLSYELVLAVALHDLAWRELDAEPRPDPEDGAPVTFYRHPLSERLAAYRRGLDQAEAIHPLAGLLGSLHYAAFPEVAEAEEFQAAERERRRRLRARLALTAEDERWVDRQLAFLRLFDRLSLFLCLTPPSAEPGSWPAWVDETRHPRTPAGATFHLTWVDDAVAHADPFPWREALELEIPYRELPAGPYAGSGPLAAAWREAEERTWWVTLRPAPRLA